MSAIVTGALRAIELFHPELTPFLEQVIKYEPELEKLAPVVKSAIEEGSSALAAAEEAAPDFVSAIKNFVRTIPGTAATHAESTAVQDTHAENMLRAMFAPKTPEQEKEWMDSKSPYGGDDSRTSINSG